MNYHVSRIVKLLRIREWLFSKVPFMFLPLLTYQICNRDSEIINISLCICYLVYLFAFFGYGYAINDYSDRNIDRLVGKTNIMAELSESKCRWILIILILGCIPLGLCVGKITVIPVFILVYFWGGAYSIKPFRFKERGVLGLLVSSLAQRSIPLLPLLCLSWGIFIHILFWGLAGYFVGMRYILIHQKLDIEHDKATDTHTFAGNHKEILLNMIIRIFFFAEVAMQFVIMVFLPCRMQVAILLLVYYIQLLIAFYTVHFVYGQSFLGTYVYVPMEDYYNYYLPVLLCCMLLCIDMFWITLMIFILLIGIKPMEGKWKTTLFGIRHISDCMRHRAWR